MKSPLLGLRTVTYRVSNLEEAKAWYNRVFTIEPYFDEPFYVGYNVGGYELGLVPVEDENRNDTVTTYWGVEDVNGMITHLLENGATIYENPTDVGDGIIVAAVKDPWGNIVGVIYNPHFSVGG